MESPPIAVGCFSRVFCAVRNAIGLGIYFFYQTSSVLVKPSFPQMIWFGRILFNDRIGFDMKEAVDMLAGRSNVVSVELLGCCY